MDNLVFSNIFYRKTRTVTSIIGVAIGVVLVLLTVGISNGFLSEQGRRNSAVTAEIWFRPPGGFSLNLTSTLTMQSSIAGELLTIPGVSEAVPVGIFLRGSGGMVNGIEYEPFTRVTGVQIVEGRPCNEGNEVIIDRVLQQNRKVKVGDEIEVLERPFKIVGIYEPESLGRIKVPLKTMQQVLNTPDLCSVILVKVEDPSKQEEVAAQIKERFPKNSLDLTRDLPILYARGTPALHAFLRVVLGLAIIVSSLVILLTMYTTVIERTRQIGILKSLGASSMWIAGEIEKEALLISFLGVMSGFVLAVAGKFLIGLFATMNIEFQAEWFFYVLVMGMLSGAMGALYPALRAARQDPVKALSYE